MKKLQMLFAVSKCVISYATIVFFIVCSFFIINSPRLFSLDAHWSSDEARWLRRSATFMDTVKQGHFSETLIAYHPGVVPMWVAGLRTFFIPSRVPVLNLDLARWFIGIVTSVSIGVICLLLYKLFGQWKAFSSLICLSYSPLFLAQTRRVGTDALATVFIIIAVLLFLLYCNNWLNHKYLIFSGITFGLAVLSKSYALIILLWVPLCLFLYRPPLQKNGVGVSTYIVKILCFINCALITVLAVWPVFWTSFWAIMALCLLVLTYLLYRAVENEYSSSVLIGVACSTLVCTGVLAAQTVWIILDRVGWAVTTPHEVDHFFLGKIVNDPGWLFYPFVLTIRSTPLLLPLAFLGCFLLWKYRKNSAENFKQLKLVLAMIGIVVLFTVCLSLTSKKFSRYLLPVFPVLDILAAVGFVEVIRWCFKRFRIKTTVVKRTIAGFACLCFFFIQILPVLMLHPYYGTYYNPFWKVTDITKIITVGDASGLDIAANYLNQKPNAERMQVQISPLATELVRYYFHGHVYRSDRQNSQIPDYEIVYIRDSQIGRVPQTGTLNGELEHVISLNGIDHVWIYKVKPMVN